MTHTLTKSLSRFLGAAIIVGFVAGCATPPEDPEERAEYEAANDPLEPLNREVFDFNNWLDRNAIKPAAIAYRDTVPEGIRDSTQNFFNNVASPVTFANDILQGESGRAAETLMRFVVNSTAGMAGFFDAAGEMGLERHEEDFGQTLAVWGVPDGPYLMLPLLGPSSVRDASGRVVDRFINPLFWVGQEINPVELDYYGYASTPIEGLNRRVAVLGVLDEIERTSIDYYAAIRSLYRQQRANDIRNDRPATEDLPAPSISELD
ncbi:MAG: VacJ family lipoprotein [Alphaproteobacteria bacterium]|nr:VacJ family lipoprotein [Alphaproteobacteria bacterium]